MGSALPEEVPGHRGDEAQQLKEEIERTRAHLGATVEQLAAQVDVKSRVQAQAAELTGRLKRVTSAQWAMAAGAAVAIAALVIWQRRKR